MASSSEKDYLKSFLLDSKQALGGISNNSSRTSEIEFCPKCLNCNNDIVRNRISTIRTVTLTPQQRVPIYSYAKTEADTVKPILRTDILDRVDFLMRRQETKQRQAAFNKRHLFVQYELGTLLALPNVQNQLATSNAAPVKLLLNKMNVAPVISSQSTASKARNGNSGLAICMLGNTKIGKSVLLARLVSEGSACDACRHAFSHPWNAVEAKPLLLKNKRSAVDVAEFFRLKRLEADENPEEKDKKPKRRPIKARTNISSQSDSEVSHSIYANFSFCKSERSGMSESAKIALLALSLQFAQNSSMFKSVILQEFLSCNEDQFDSIIDNMSEEISSWSLDSTFKRLISEPAMAMESHPEFNPFDLFTIIIDDIHKSTDAEELFDTISVLAPKLPPHICFIYSMNPTFSLTLRDADDIKVGPEETCFQISCNQNFEANLETLGNVLILLESAQTENVAFLRDFIDLRVSNLLEKGDKTNAIPLDMVQKVKNDIMWKSGGAIGNLQYLDHFLVSNPQQDPIADGVSKFKTFERLLSSSCSQLPKDDCVQYVSKLAVNLPEENFRALFFPLLFASSAETTPVEFELHMDYVKHSLRMNTAQATVFLENCLADLEHAIDIRKGREFKYLQSLAIPAGFLRDEIINVYLTRYNKPRSMFDLERDHELQVFVKLCLEACEEEQKFNYLFTNLLKHLYELRDLHNMQKLVLNDFFFLSNCLRVLGAEEVATELRKCYFDLADSMHQTNSIGFKKMCLLLNVFIKSSTVLSKNFEELESQFVGRLNLFEREAFEALLLDADALNQDGDLFSHDAVAPVAKWIPLTGSLELASLPVVDSFKIVAKETGPQPFKIVSIREHRLLLVCFPGKLQIFRFRAISLTESVDLQKSPLIRNMEPLTAIELDENNDSLIDAYFAGGYLIYVTSARAVCCRVEVPGPHDDGDEEVFISKSSVVFSRPSRERFSFDTKVGLIAHDGFLVVFLSDFEKLLSFRGFDSSNDKTIKFVFTGSLKYQEVTEDHTGSSMTSSEASQHPTRVSVIQAFGPRNLLIGTVTGQVFLINLLTDNSPSARRKPFVLKYLFDVAQQTGGSGDTIAKVHGTKTDSGYEFFVGTENGFIGVYYLDVIGSSGKKKKKGAKVAQFIGEISPVSSSKVRDSQVSDSQYTCLAFGSQKILSKHNNYVQVRDLKRLQQYDLPVNAESLSFIEPLDASGGKFITLTEDHWVKIWDIDLLELKGHSSESVVGSLRTRTVGNSTKKEEDEASETSADDGQDDVDFFLATTQQVMTSSSSEHENAPFKELEIPDSGEAVVKGEDEIDAEEEDDTQFFLSTNSAISNFKKKESELILEKKRKREYRFSKVQIDCSSEYRYSEWVTSLEINETKNLAAVGYKDGRLALFTLSKSFFVNAAEQKREITQIASRPLPSMVISLHISQPGKYLVCYTRNSYNVYAISRTGFKNNGTSSHLHLIWSQMKEDNRHKYVSFSTCTTYIKLWDEDPNCRPTILNLQQVRKLSFPEIFALEESVKWEKKPKSPEVQIIGDKVTGLTGLNKEASEERFIPFTMEGKENIFSSFSTKHRIAVVAQGNSLHFLKLALIGEKK